MTHVLLLLLVLARHADTAAVIGSAFAAKAAGAGHRRIAAALGRPAETVRGRLRRLPGGRGGARGVHPLIPGMVLPGPAWADAVAAITASAGAVGARFGLSEMAYWEVTATVSTGRLRAPVSGPAARSG